MHLLFPYILSTCPNHVSLLLSVFPITISYVSNSSIVFSFQIDAVHRIELIVQIVQLMFNMQSSTEPIPRVSLISMIKLSAHTMSYASMKNCLQCLCIILDRLNEKRFVKYSST